MLLRRILESVFVVLLCFHLNKKTSLKISSSQEGSVFLPINLKLDPEVGFCFQWRFHQCLISWLLRGYRGQWTELQSCHRAFCVLPSGVLACTPSIPLSPPFLFLLHFVFGLWEYWVLQNIWAITYPCTRKSEPGCFANDFCKNYPNTKRNDAHLF